MAEPDKMEPEVYLRHIGCPHKLGAPETSHWLDGFRAGMNFGANIATDSFREVLEEGRDGRPEQDCS